MFQNASTIYIGYRKEISEILSLYSNKMYREIFIFHILYVLPRLTARILHFYFGNEKKNDIHLQE